jgi:hypothetical protein
MSEYCSQCSPFKKQGEWDIDLIKIALHLKNGHSKNILCEGCSNRAIYKDEEGHLFLAKQVYDEHKLFPVNIEDLL